MSDDGDGDVDVESAEDVPEIGGEATATTANQARLFVRTIVVKTLYQEHTIMELFTCCCTSAYLALLPKL